MPFIANTPESLLGRQDSLNPNTTCRGINSSGKPCRRSLAQSKSPKSSPRGKKSDRLRPVDPSDPSDPDLYCWQHKDQANQSVQSTPGAGSGNNGPILEQRESFDSMMGRLGLEDEQQNQSSGSHGGGEKIWQTQSSSSRPSRRKRKEFNFCCCFSIPLPIIEEEPPRPGPRPVQPQPTYGRPTSKPPSNQHLAAPRPSLSPSSKHSSGGSNISHQSQYMSIIPPTASPETASKLMKEMARPISKGDEAGYIYIFWLTPESETAEAPTEAARELISPPTTSRDLNFDLDSYFQRASDVVDSFATRNTPVSTGKKKTMLLKIGRASNVQRRLNEWTRQCGYNISLIRYYPYVSSNDSSTPRKMPHSHKVERLVHLELGGLGLRISDRENCPSCGRAHKEWFEIDATREGIQAIDECIKRWSDWDEQRG